MEVTVYSQGMSLRISFHLPNLSAVILQLPAWYVLVSIYFLDWDVV